MYSRRLSLALAGLALTLGVAACGDEGGGSSAGDDAGSSAGTEPAAVEPASAEASDTSVLEGSLPLLDGSEHGFTVLGFPADDVAGQEPRDDEAIAALARESRNTRDMCGYSYSRRPQQCSTLSFAARAPRKRAVSACASAS